MITGNGYQLKVHFGPDFTLVTDKVLTADKTKGSQLRKKVATYRSNHVNDVVNN